MTVEDAQQQVRVVYLGGSVGQFMSGGIWLMSAVTGTFVGQTQGILALVLGGMLIFPLTQLGLKLMGRPASLGRDNPLYRIPLTSVCAMVAMYPLIYAAARYSINWFFPAFMVVVGAHFLWFIFLYGMWQYGVLAAVLVGGGIAIGLLFSNSFSIGGWTTGLVLLLFALIIWHGRARERL